MKHNIKLIGVFFSLLLLFGCSSGINQSQTNSENIDRINQISSGINQSQTNSENIDRIYQIYLQAQQSGYEGTYEEWLESIKGKDGHTPTISIGDNGNWFIDNVDTTVKAKGVDGKDGHTPTISIGDNGNWFIDNVDTTIKAKGVDGKDGHSPTISIGDNGNWFIDNVDTTVKAKGVDGKDGHSPIISIGDNGNWFIDNVDTTVKAKGVDGKDGHSPILSIGENGNWFIDNSDTSIKAKGVDGKDGVSILKIEKESTKDNIDTYKISYSDNTSSTFTITNGVDGKSAYQIYVENNKNYNGSEEQWIDDLVNGKLYNSKITYSNALNIIENFYEGEEIKLPEKACVYSIERDKWTYENVEWDLKDKTYNCGTYEIYGSVDGLKQKVTCTLNISKYNSKVKTVDGYVNGLANGTEANVILFNQDTYLITETKNGYYKFENLDNGDYLIRAEAQNFYSSDNKELTIDDVDKDNRSLFDNVSHIYFELNYIYDYSYYYCWNSNAYYFGDETTSSINVPNVIQIDGYKNNIADNSASLSLINKYNVYLSNDGDQEWNSQYANSFYNSLERLNVNLTKKSIWKISNEYLQNDVTILKGTDYDIITISKQALTYCSPLSGKLNGVNGTFFSKRLYSAITRYVTNNGTDTTLVDKILKDNFAVSIIVPDYTELTRGITDEGPEMFQQFTPEELLDILMMYEEMPEGYHKINGFNYIIRRKTGIPHPIYPSAAAVTWPQKGYIEFMSVAFTEPSVFDTYRLIIHEKTHMLWANVFSDELKAEWIKIGGWYQEDPQSDEWFTTKTTEFVSAYAHNNNPNEDMAESCAFYITDPEKLKSRSPAKYEFLEEYIFHGSRYITQIRDDLTFEVFNLMPDYDYPGKIIKVEIMSNSSVYEDKEFKIRLTLKEQTGFDDSASKAYARIACVDDPMKFDDVFFYPVDGNGYILEGTFKVTKTTQAGYYVPNSIILYDKSGNERIEGTKDFGFKLYVDNPLEDLDKPSFEKNSINISVTEIPSTEIENFSNYLVDISIKLVDKNLKSYNAIVARIYPVIHNPDYNVLDSWGHLGDDGLYHIYYTLTDYHPSGEYYIEQITIVDNSLNSISFNRYNTILKDEAINFNVPTRYPDMTGPELDLNNITITATSTNPDAPNGETKVEITIRVKDDAAGLRNLSYRLIDPQGVQHFMYFYTDNYGKTYFNGDPTVWKEYKIVTILPPGSAPGIWGLSEMTLIDMVQNQTKYDFTEIIHFEIDE